MAARLGRLGTTSKHPLRKRQPGRLGSTHHGCSAVTMSDIGANAKAMASPPQPRQKPPELRAPAPVRCIWLLGIRRIIKHFRALKINATIFRFPLTLAP